MCEAVVLSWRMGHTPISPADIWQCLQIFLVIITKKGLVPLLFSNELKPEMLLNMLLCTGKPPTIIIQPQILRLLRPKNTAI